MSEAQTPQTPSRSWSRPTRHDFYVFEKIGDVIEGKVLGFREITTVHGTAPVVDLETEDGKKYAVIVSKGMQTLTPDLIGAFIRLEYQGYDKNPKTGQMFKKFDLMVDTVDLEKIAANADEDPVPF